VSKIKDQRTRYVVIRLDHSENVPRPVLIKAIMQASRSIGERCYEEVGPWLTYFENNYGVIRYNHIEKDQMLAIMDRLRILDNKNGAVVVRTLGVSGTINKARKKYIP
jgi:RNase P/RNase MRP subunit POP5